MTSLTTILTHSISKEARHLHSLPRYFDVDGVDAIFLLLVTLAGNVIGIQLIVQVLNNSCY